MITDESLSLLPGSPFVLTERLRSRHNEAVTMSNIQEFDLRGQLVPPNLVPLFFGLTIAGELIRKTCGRKRLADLR